MNKIISDNLDKIRELCERYQVKSLYLFGSAATDDHFTADSDVDLLISFNPMDQVDYADNYFEVADELEHVFKLPVDLVTGKSLSNPYFIKSVNNTRTLLYGA